MNDSVHLFPPVYDKPYAFTDKELRALWPDCPTDDCADTDSPFLLAATDPFHFVTGDALMHTLLSELRVHNVGTVGLHSHLCAFQRSWTPVSG